MRRHFAVLLALVALTLHPTSAAANEKDDDSQNSFQTAETPFALTARYFGETITHPGMTAGIEFYPRETFTYKLIVASNLGWYRHFRNHRALFFDAEVGARLTAPFGLFGETMVGLGYYHRWPDATVYKVDASGDARRHHNRGSPALMGLASVGIGWDFSRNFLPPFGVHLRAGVFGEYPYNRFVLAHVFVQAGLSYRF